MSKHPDVSDAELERAGEELANSLQRILLRYPRIKSVEDLWLLTQAKVRAELASSCTCAEYGGTYLDGSHLACCPAHVAETCRRCKQARPEWHTEAPEGRS